MYGITLPMFVGIWVDGRMSNSFHTAYWILRKSTSLVFLEWLLTTRQSESFWVSFGCLVLARLTKK